MQGNRESLCRWSPSTPTGPHSNRTMQVCTLFLCCLFPSRRCFLILLVWQILSKYSPERATRSSISNELTTATVLPITTGWQWSVSSSGIPAVGHDLQRLVGVPCAVNAGFDSARCVSVCEGVVSDTSSLRVDHSLTRAGDFAQRCQKSSGEGGVGTGVISCCNT